MNLIRLYIQNFVCHKESFIDFTLFNSALIVGKIENNDLYSNGVGKTTIFKAIEYVFFNQADVNLEKIIRDDTNACKVACDFTVGSQMYRVIRTRTRKGITDLSLYERTAQGDLSEESDLITHKKCWKDISGRRAADTEKDLSKLLKINFKSFRVFVHFMQNDFSGLTSATPEKRKGILKDALNLIIYSKLEKIAKDKFSSLSKELERFQILIDALGDPDQDLLELSKQFAQVNKELTFFSEELLSQEKLIKNNNDIVQNLINSKNNLIEKFTSLIVKDQNLSSEKNRIEISIKEYHTKKSNVINVAREIAAEVKQLEEIQIKLIKTDYNQIDILSEQIITNKEKIAQLSLTIQNDISRYEKLKIPIPNNGECEHCRQILSEEHKKVCQQNINQEILEKQKNIQLCKKEVAILNQSNNLHQQNINNLISSKQYLENINFKIANKKKEISDKRLLHDEYKILLEKFTIELQNKNKEIDQSKLDLENSSANEIDKLKNLIELEKNNLDILLLKLDNINKNLSHNNNIKAVLQHTINQKTEEKKKKIDFSKIIIELENKLRIYPFVLQAFSTTGIPNLIIQNVLDDLQLESNKLLTQLKPGLQLSFLIEKTKGDGTETDTLDINYYVNGKERYYEQLSGAMKLAATFSLKLGLSFLLQKMIGVDIKFLLLDEIDQSLDKASVDAFADIVKFFQNEFKILIITHNDRLKDKFSHAILVKQDIEMISHAQVVSSW